MGNHTSKKLKNKKIIDQFKKNIHFVNYPVIPNKINNYNQYNCKNNL